MRFRLSARVRLSANSSRLLCYVALLLLGLGSLAMAAKRFVMPHPAAAKTFPACDDHPAENVTIAIDPYDNPQKESIFSGRYLERDLLPALLIVSNRGVERVVLSDISVRLVLRDRSKISPASEEDVYRRLSRGPGNDSGVSRFPLPTGPRAPKAGVSREVRDELGTALFQAQAVEPGATQSGFLFFDLSNTQKSLAGAHLYVTGVRNGGGDELMFFDIPLDKYLAASTQAEKP